MVREDPAVRSPTPRPFLAGDVVAAVVVLLAAWAATTVHGAVVALAGPAREAAAGAGSMADRLSSVATELGRVPLVGDEASVPMTQAAEAANGLAATANGTVESIQHLALTLALVTFLLPLLAAVAFRLLPRRRRSRRLAELDLLRGSAAGQRLLALRALTELPAARLLQIHPDPAAAWASADADVVRRLADARSSELHRR